MARVRIKSYDRKGRFVRDSSWQRTAVRNIVAVAGAVATREKGAKKGTKTEESNVVVIIKGARSFLLYKEKCHRCDTSGARGEKLPPATYVAHEIKLFPSRFGGLRKYVRVCMYVHPPPEVLGYLRKMK